MSYQFAFEKLEVWQESRTLSKLIYKDSSIFPHDEKFGLVNQIRRAAISVCSNIAEGSGRTSVKDQAHFYQMAFSSLMEVMNQLIISSDLGYLEASKLETYRAQIAMIANKLNALRKSILKFSKR